MQQGLGSRHRPPFIRSSAAAWSGCQAKPTMLPRGHGHRGTVSERWGLAKQAWRDRLTGISFCKRGARHWCPFIVYVAPLHTHSFIVCTSLSVSVWPRFYTVCWRNCKCLCLLHLEAYYRMIALTVLLWTVKRQFLLISLNMFENDCKISSLANCLSLHNENLLSDANWCSMNITALRLQKPPPDQLLTLLWWRLEPSVAGHISHHSHAKIYRLPAAVLKGTLQIYFDYDAAPRVATI